MDWQSCWQELVVCVQSNAIGISLMVSMHKLGHSIGLAHTTPAKSLVSRSKSKLIAQVVIPCQSCINLEKQLKDTYFDGHGNNFLGWW